jgi:hypothetical protein
MSTKLAMVTTTERAAQQPALSPARAAVARARDLRKDADAALSEAVKAQKAAEQLVWARAMPALNIKIRKAQTSSSDAIAAIRLAVVSVLADDAQSIIEDIRRLDQESARCRALLEAAIRHLDRTMAQHRLLDAGTAAQRLRLSVPAHNGPTEASIAAAVPKWNEFSERLFADEHAKLEGETS